MKYKSQYEKLKEANKTLKKKYTMALELSDLILTLKRKCDNQGIWLSAGLDVTKPLVAESQQGPMITKLYELAEQIGDKHV